MTTRSTSPLTKAQAGDFSEYFSGDFTNPNYSYSYFHSRDFNIGLDYRVGEDLECHVNLQGLYGPVVSPTPARPVPTFTGSFSISRQRQRSRSGRQHQ